MTLEEVKEMLGKTGFPVAYRAFSGRQEPPFIVYLTDGDENFSADGRVYYSAHSIRVELYTRIKDQSAEAAVENALSSVYYTKQQVFIDTEGVYETIYEMEV